MTTVVTLVALPGQLRPLEIEKAMRLLKSLGVYGLEERILSANEAVDILCPESGDSFHQKIRATLADFSGVDVFVQSETPDRRKKLLVADMDATMIEQETLDELAAHCGLQDKIVPITEKAMRGEIDFREALEMRVALLKGMPLAALHETLSKVKYSKGAARLVKTMCRFGARCVLVSGGFDLFTHPVGMFLGFGRDVGNRLEVVEDRLTGRVLPPIIDKHVKEKVLSDEAAAIGVPLSSVMAVGDGANDIPMLQKAGVGVGYFGKPAVVAATPHQVRHTTLETLLFMQGYRAEEILR